MLANPRLNQLVRVRYNPRIQGMMPLQGQLGHVVKASRGKPRNHLVDVNGRLYCVPCGNLFRV